MTYWLHPEAEEELGAAAEYYALRVSAAVAESYVQEFERVLAAIAGNQQIGTRTDAGLRRYPFRRFPYVVIYRENPAGPQIYAVAHQSREPGYWSGRTRVSPS